MPFTRFKSVLRPDRSRSRGRDHAGDELLLIPSVHGAPERPRPGLAGGSVDPSGFPELTSLAASGSDLQAALVHGFRLVMLYGGISVWILALASYLIFGGKARISEACLAK